MKKTAFDEAFDKEIMGIDDELMNIDQEDTAEKKKEYAAIGKNSAAGFSAPAFAYRDYFKKVASISFAIERKTAAPNPVRLKRLLMLLAGAAGTAGVAGAANPGMAENYWSGEGKDMLSDTAETVGNYWEGVPDKVKEYLDNRHYSESDTPINVSPFIEAKEPMTVEEMRSPENLKKYLARGGEPDPLLGDPLQSIIPKGNTSGKPAAGMAEQKKVTVKDFYDPNELAKLQGRQEVPEKETFDKFMEYISGEGREKAEGVAKTVGDYWKGEGKDKIKNVAGTVGDYWKGEGKDMLDEKASAVMNYLKSLSPDVDFNAPLPPF